MGTQLLPLVPRRFEKKVENRATLLPTLPEAASVAPETYESRGMYRPHYVLKF